MFEFLGNIVQAVVNVITGGADAVIPDPNDPCNAPACVAATDRLDSERKGFNQVCMYIKILNGILLFAAIFTAVPFWVIGVLVLVSMGLSVLGGFGQIIALLIWAFIAAWAIAWFVTFIISMILPYAGLALAERAAAVLAAIVEVRLACPAECQGDLSPPECSLPQQL